MKKHQVFTRPEAEGISRLLVAEDLPYRVAIEWQIELPPQPDDMSVAANRENWLEKAWAKVGRELAKKAKRDKKRKRGHPPASPRPIDIQILQIAELAARDFGVPINKALRQAVAYAMELGLLVAHSARGSNVTETHFKRLLRIRERRDRSARWLLDQMSDEV
jgi:hypothetical protein